MARAMATDSSRKEIRNAFSGDVKNRNVYFATEETLRSEESQGLSSSKTSQYSRLHQNALKFWFSKLDAF